VVLQAQGRVRRAWAAVRGPGNDAAVADTVRLVVLGWASLRAIGDARRFHRQTAGALLVVGLERLANHYGLTRGLTANGHVK
jgi:hypothetical protein